MAKLYFRYGAMNSGKSTGLLQAAYNYEERGQRVLIAKPQLDTKGEEHVVSRLGVTRRADFLIGSDANVRELFLQEAEGGHPDAVHRHLPVSCLLVDEAQFLTSDQVDDLMRIAVLDGVPVMCYGIRTDFQTRAFPGSARLLEIAHTLEELKTICRCGKKALFNGRTVDGTFIFSGSQVAIDGVHVGYESLCANCYLEESGGALQPGANG